MSLQKQQDFLARLFTDESLRQSFLSEPRKIGLANGLNEKDIAALENILPEQLNFFGDSLFWKRLREVEKFLPETKKDLEENFTNLFREFSQIYNPHSTKKHLEDAVKFCDFLLQKFELPEQKKLIVKFEKAKLKFFGYGKRFAFCRLNKNLLSNKKSLSIWVRFNGKIYYFVL